MGHQPVLLEPGVVEHQHAEAVTVFQHTLCHLLNEVCAKMQLLGPGIRARAYLPLTGGPARFWFWLSPLPASTAPFHPARSVGFRCHRLGYSRVPGNPCKVSWKSPRHPQRAPPMVVTFLGICVA